MKSKKLRYYGIVLCMMMVFSVMMCVGRPASVQAKGLKGRVATVNASVLNLRKGTSTSSHIVQKLSYGDRMNVNGRTGDWLKVKAFHKGKSYRGYVYKPYVKICPRGRVNYEYLNLRAKPNTDSRIRVRLSEHDRVHILKVLDKWYKVVAVHKGKRRLGYVYASYIKTNASMDKGRVIYLTFDDGPGAYTKKLLNILKKHNVKATFFVTNQYPNYQNLIKKETEDGHTVAVHTYSHDYAKIYKSKSAYIDDLDKMAAIIKKQTGKKPNILRFPGGSSNTISRHYCSGIMSTLADYVGDYGYAYSDWNVTSGDAGETTSTNQVYQNVINGIKGQGDKPSVVLQHDIKDFSVDAVEDIIRWGKDHGYTFKAMTKTKGIVHHGINN